jgi:hypothetical protein
MPRNFDPELASVVQVLLPARDSGKGGRSATRLSVCRRSQDGGDRGGGVQWILTNATTDVPCQQLNFRAAAIRIFEKYITYIRMINVPF